MMDGAGIVVTPDVKLKRFLYTASEKPIFATGDVERYKHYTPTNLNCISEFLQTSNPEKLFNIIEIVHSEGLLARRETVFFALAVAAATITNEALKCRLYRTLITLIRDARDLCTYVKFYTKQHKKFSSAVNKLVTTYYNGKEPKEFLQEITRCTSYHKWTHKDLLKLSHFKWQNNEIAVIAVYVLYGLKKAQLVGEEVGSVGDILAYLKKLEDMKRSEDEKRVVELIPELHCTLARVPSIFHHSQAVWEALLAELTLQDIIIYLPRLFKEGFLKSTTFQNKLIEKITNIEIIKESKIHPVEVFLGLRNFEKGGKPMDPKFKDYLKELKRQNPEMAKQKEPQQASIKCPSVVNALNKVLQASVQNLNPWGRKILITIDVTKKMKAPCLNSANITCLEAAAIMTFSIIKVERDVSVAVFNENKIVIISFEKSITLNQLIAKLKGTQRKSAYCSPAAPIEWAMSRRKPVDVFINFLYYHHWLLLIPQELRAKEKPIPKLITYRKKMALPHAKLVSFSLGSPHVRMADGSPNVLDIYGFDKHVHSTLEAFSKGLF